MSYMFVGNYALLIVYMEGFYVKLLLLINKKILFVYETIVTLNKQFLTYVKNCL
jgi:hypothetical protein